MFRNLCCNDTGLENKGGSTPLPRMLGGGGGRCRPFVTFHGIEREAGLAH